MTFTEQFLAEAKAIIDGLSAESIERMANLLAAVRDAGGRLFVLGLGGSAANASHVVNDFRRIATMEAYAPTDNVAELTGDTNDKAWDSVFVSWLKVSRLAPKDAVLALSTCGESTEQKVSTDLAAALEYAKLIGAKVLGILGCDGGRAAQVADVFVVVPTVNPVHDTLHAEAFQALLWHLLVSHPRVKQVPTR